MFSKPAIVFMTLLGISGVMLIALLLWAAERLVRVQAVALASLAFTVSLSAVARGWLRGKNRHSAKLDEVALTESQITHFWGRSIAKFSKLTDLAEKRMTESQMRLDVEFGSDRTPLYEVIRMGYKCIQNARAVQTLCLGGYPDQALILCRTLEEQMINLWFIMTSGAPEEVIQRYIDWHDAKFYRDTKKQRERLDESGQGPTDLEWKTLTEEYERAKEKYARQGEDIDKSDEGWAIAYRDNQIKPIRRQNVPDRAQEALPRLKSDPILLQEVWRSWWQYLSEFVHATPHSLRESASNPRDNEVGTGPSVIGLKDPMTIAGGAILNISSLLTSYMPTDETRRMKRIGKRTLKAYKEMINELERVPKEVQPWWYRVRPTTDSDDVK